MAFIVIRTIKGVEVKKYLDDNGIQTLIHYPIPTPKQNPYNEFNILIFPIKELIHNEVLSLALSLVITNEEIQSIAIIINQFND